MSGFPQPHISSFLFFQRKKHQVSLSRSVKVMMHLVVFLGIVLVVNLSFLHSLSRGLLYCSAAPMLELSVSERMLSVLHADFVVFALSVLALNTCYKHVVNAYRCGLHLQCIFMCLKMNVGVAGNVADKWLVIYECFFIF